MSILVTGADGQVGRELVARSLPGETVATTRKVLDIANADAVAATIARCRPLAVINAAAYTAVDKAENEPAAAYAANRDGPAVLARACADAEIPLLHLSTDYVFDGTKSEPYTEQCPTNPLGVYGQSKWEGEEAIRRYLPQHVILRVSWVFGAYGNNFVRTMLRLGQERDELRVVADQRGAPTYAGAIAEALLAVARKLPSDLPWGTYHYTGAPATTWHGFAQVLFDEAVSLGLLNRKPVVHAITTAEYPTPARRPENSELGSVALQNLALNPMPWIDGLRETLSAWK